MTETCLLRYKRNSIQFLRQISKAQELSKELQVHNYTLKDGVPVKEDDLIKWILWMESADRHVKKDTVGGSLVSTVFLGTDHNFSRLGSPILYETMVFDGPCDGRQRRYSTVQEAIDGHEEILEEVRRSQKSPV